ncbi:MAG: SMC-Scp complex subunit ScpB [Candidatus Spyradosoma sp.]
MGFHLKKILKAMLASTSEPLSVKDIQAVVTRWHEQREKDAAAAAGTPAEDDGNAAAPAQGLIEDIISQVPTLLTATQIREAVAELNQEMEESGDVTRILQGPEGFRMTIAPDYAEWIRLLRNDPRPQKLTQAALETLAVVAYRQPVTRGEIEAIRGVSADSAVARLLDLELIAVSGRADLPGRPSQFSTTPKFLDFVGLRTISELPESDVLSPAQISAWIERAKNPVKATAADVGLPEGESVPVKQTEIPLESAEDA